MKDETADSCYPLLDYTLTLSDVSIAARRSSLDEEQSFLGRLLTRELRTEDSTPASDETVTSRQIEELRYAMVCAVDEFFISSTSWKDRWNERKLESKYYATNDRAWKFWRGANQAFSAGDVEMVEVYLLCVMLGFRGQMAEDRKDYRTGWGKHSG